MTNIVRKIFLIVFFLVLLILPKETFATFDISIEEDYKTIEFGAMEMGEEKIISRKGGYEHQFNFTSTNKRIWYFKAQLLRPFTSMAHSIPPENFQCMVEELRNGQGFLSNNISTPVSFANYPVLIYTSSGTDNDGTEVQMRLRYKLNIPKAQAAGSYTAHVRFIMVEEL